MPSRLKILSTTITETDVQMILSDHDDTDQATIYLSCRLPRPPQEPNTQSRNRKALVGVQIEALRQLRDAIDAEISAL